VPRGVASRLPDVVHRVSPEFARKAPRETILDAWRRPGNPPFVRTAHGRMDEVSGALGRTH